jgi:6-phosphogluconate dehydrogenase (decarboxylating)
MSSWFQLQSEDRLGRTASLKSTEDRFHAVVDELLRDFKRETKKKHAAEIEQLKEQIEQMTKERKMWEMQK